MAQQDDWTRTALRVPPELHKKLHAAREANGRGFNDEVVARLLASFERDPVEKRLSAVEKVLARLEKLLKP